MYKCLYTLHYVGIMQSLSEIIFTFAILVLYTIYGVYFNPVSMIIGAILLFIMVVLTVKFSLTKMEQCRMELYCRND